MKWLLCGWILDLFVRAIINPAFAIGMAHQVEICSPEGEWTVFRALQKLTL